MLYLLYNCINRLHKMHRRRARAHCAPTRAPRNAQALRRDARCRATTTAHAHIRRHCRALSHYPAPHACIAELSTTNNNQHAHRTPTHRQHATSPASWQTNRAYNIRNPVAIVRTAVDATFIHRIALSSRHPISHRSLTGHRASRPSHRARARARYASVHTSSYIDARTIASRNYHRPSSPNLRCARRSRYAHRIAACNAYAIYLHIAFIRISQLALSTTPRRKQAQSPHTRVGSTITNTHNALIPPRASMAAGHRNTLPCPARARALRNNA